jgi:hypothetical protein
LRLTRRPWVASHATIRREGQILPIDQGHDREIFVADLDRLPIDRSARHRQQPALLGYRQRPILAFDQRTTLGSPPDQVWSSPGASCQKIVFDLQLADLPVQNIDLCLAGRTRRRRAAVENARGAVEKLLLPVVDLVRMNPERAGPLGDRPIAPCLRRGKLLIAANATFALNAALCFFRVCFISCSRAISAF